MGLIKNREYKQEAAYHTDHGFVLSMGNRKMGRVMSFSLPPGLTCADDIPCLSTCYAAKMERIYPTVKNSWKNNYDLLQKYWGDVFVNDICAAIRKKKPELFRWHVGGDIFSKDYLDNMCLIAKKNKDVKFWAFTKQFSVLEDYDDKIPENLTIVLSVWPPHVPSDELKEKYGCCYFQDAEENYDVPEDAFICDGDCEMCRRCVELRANESVVIYKH